jgi:hypothetical protein
MSTTCGCGNGLFCKCNSLDANYDWVIYGYFLCGNHLEPFLTIEGKLKLIQLKKDQETISKRIKDGK